MLWVFFPPLGEHHLATSCCNIWIKGWCSNTKLLPKRLWGSWRKYSSLNLKIQMGDTHRQLCCSWKQEEMKEHCPFIFRSKKTTIHREGSGSFTHWDKWVLYITVSRYISPIQSNAKFVVNILSSSVTINWPPLYHPWAKHFAVDFQPLSPNIQRFFPLTYYFYSSTFKSSVICS